MERLERQEMNSIIIDSISIFYTRIKARIYSLRRNRDGVLQEEIVRKETGRE